MLTTRRAVAQLTTANLMIGGISILGWVAIVVLSVFVEPLKVRLGNALLVSDAIFLAIMFLGPACFVAGIGLWNRRQWGRWMTLGIGVVAGVLFVSGIVFACFGVLRGAQFADFGLFAGFAGYAGWVFVILWNDPFAAEPSERLS